VLPRLLMEASRFNGLPWLAGLSVAW